MIEERTSATILEKHTEIEICGKSYSVAPPTLATLIMASSEISKLPKINENLKGEEALYESLRYAKKSSVIADIATILIVGAKDYTKYLKKNRILKFFGVSNRVEKLRYDILNSSPKKLDEIVGLCLQGMEIQDFFLLTTFLNRVNLTKETK